MTDEVYDRYVRMLDHMKFGYNKNNNNNNRLADCITFLKTTFDIDYDMDKDIYIQALYKIESGEYNDQFGYGTMAELHTYLCYFVNIINTQPKVYEFTKYVHACIDNLSPPDLVNKFRDVIPSYINDWNTFEEIEDIDDIVEKSARLGTLYEDFMSLTTPIGLCARNEYMELYQSTIDTLSITHIMYTRDEMNDILSNLHIHDGLATIIMDHSVVYTTNDSIGIDDMVRILVATCIVISIGVCTYMYFRHKQTCK